MVTNQSISTLQANQPTIKKSCSFPQIKMSLGCILPLVVVLAAVSMATGDNFSILKARFDGWKPCHPGYKGFSEAQMKGIKKCDAMNIKDHMCYLSCIRWENGMVGADGKWSDDVGKKNLDEMWENTPPAKMQALYWYRDTKVCISEFEKTHQWPKDYSGTCPEVQYVHDCLDTARNCK